MDDLRRDLFRLIDQTPMLDWLILTKRPENVPRMWLGGAAPIEMADDRMLEVVIDGGTFVDVYRRNVWLGTSCSEQASADAVIPELLKCRDIAPVLFLSCEPLLGPVQLTGICSSPSCFNALQYGPLASGNTIDWVIVGGESNGRRVGRLGAFRDEDAWWQAADSIRAQCESANVAFFLKQGPRNGKVSHNPSEWPASCRVRQFPSASPAPLREPSASEVPAHA